MKVAWVIFLYIVILLPIKTISQNRTSELYRSGSKRREIVYDQKFQTIKETYYQDMSNRKIATIEYKENSDIKKFVGYNEKATIDIIVDFENGTYDDFYLGNHLRFKNNFVFNGVQNNRIITVNYKDGLRSGILLENDSIMSGSIIGSTIGINRELLNYGQTRIERQYEARNTYKLFTSFKIIFKDDLLDGDQICSFPNGKVKMKSLYENGKMISLKILDKDSSIISKINTKDGISGAKYILNGQVVNHDNNHIFMAYELNNIGKIIADMSSDNYHLENGWSRETANIGEGDKIVETLYLKNGRYHPCGMNQTFQKDVKRELDKSLYEFNLNTLKAIVGIPRFSINTFDKKDLNDNFLIIAEISVNSNMKASIHKIYSSLDDISSDGLYDLPDRPETIKKKEEKNKLINAYLLKVYSNIF